MSDSRDSTSIMHTPSVLLPLRDEWMSWGVPRPIQEHVRFASMLTERKGRTYIVRFASGGQGTIVEEPVKAEAATQLRELMEREYLDGAYAGDAEVAPLRSFLSRHGVEMVLSSSRIPSEAFDITLCALEALPPGHVGHEFFGILELGGWGHGSAKASEHLGSRVHLFSFATKGSRRNFGALLLHEIGHAHYARIEAKDAEAVKRIKAAQHAILERAARERPLEVWPFAVDYLLGRESRVQECLIDTREFCAEFYLTYVVRGRGIRDLLCGAADDVRAAWLDVYDVFRAGFGGVEYD